MSRGFEFEAYLTKLSAAGLMKGELERIWKERGVWPSLETLKNTTRNLRLSPAPVEIRTELLWNTNV
jgi:hypothetical protein